MEIIIFYVSNKDSFFFLMGIYIYIYKSYLYY